MQNHCNVSSAYRFICVQTFLQVFVEGVNTKLNEKTLCSQIRKECMTSKDYMRMWFSLQLLCGSDLTSYTRKLLHSVPLGDSKCSLHLLDEDMSHCGSKLVTGLVYFTNVIVWEWCTTLSPENWQYFSKCCQCEHSALKMSSGNETTYILQLIFIPIFFAV